jgi:hypothetical protein
VAALPLVVLLPPLLELPPVELEQAAAATDTMPATAMKRNLLAFMLVVTSPFG